MKTDWFELKEARLHLRPYTKGGFPIAVASVTTLTLAADVAQNRACDVETRRALDALEAGRAVDLDDQRPVLALHQVDAGDP